MMRNVRDYLDLVKISCVLDSFIIDRVSGRSSS